MYSSSVGDYVLVTNPTYQAWLAARAPFGIGATPIGSEVDLGTYLSDYGLRPVNASVLDAYKAAQANGVVDAIQFKVIFNHENRVRAVERQLGLNGSPSDLTLAQARNAVKALM